MASERWQKLDQLIEQALLLAPEERDPYLETACEGDSALLQEARSLLATHDQVEGFLEKPLLAYLAELPESAPVITEDLKRLSRYKVRSVLGSGGMGEVFLAEQLNMRRPVALKIIKPGLDHSGLTARFRAEYHALAKLVHENIARIYDTGVTPAGRPFFAMEYFPGKPLNQFLHENRPGLATRMSLFRSICKGVRHAHRQGVIHRDLKPSNVLIAEKEGQLNVKVIDFGIAKTLAEESQTPESFSGLTQAWGSPAYMSPEQLAMGPSDTRTDVFSLGAMLYTLLTGAAPFPGDPKQQRTSPLPPSRMLSLQPATDIPGKKSRWLRQLRGDLDHIVLKAIAPLPEDRYQTVDALLEDLDCLSANHPVKARPLSPAYLLGKIFRRHQWVFLTAGSVFAALLTGLLLALFGLREAGLMRKEAEKQAHQASQKVAELEDVMDFLGGFFDQSNPYGPAGREKSAAELFTQAGHRLNEIQEMPPLTRAQIHAHLGRTLTGLNQSHQAVQHWHRAMQLRIQTLGPYHPESLQARERYASSLNRNGEYTEAVHHFETVIEDQCPGIDRDHAIINLIETKVKMGSGLTNDQLTQALTLLDRVLQAELAPLERADFLYAAAMPAFAQRDLPLARFLLSWCLELREETLGHHHTETLEALNHLAIIDQEEGRLTSAESAYRHILQIRQQGLGERHIDTLLVRYNLCRNLLAQERFADALEPCEGAAKGLSALGAANPLPYAASSWAQALEKTGQTARAEEVHRQLVMPAPENVGHRMVFVNNYANFLLDQDRMIEAENILSQLLDEVPAPAQGIDRNRAYAHATLGEILVTMERHREALTQFRLALRYCPEGDLHYTYFEAYTGYCLAATGELDQGLALLEKAIARAGERYFVPQLEDLLEKIR